MCSCPLSSFFFLPFMKFFLVIKRKKVKLRDNVNDLSCLTEKLFAYSFFFFDSALLRDLSIFKVKITHSKK